MYSLVDGITAKAAWPAASAGGKIRDGSSIWVADRDRFQGPASFACVCFGVLAGVVETTAQPGSRLFLIPNGKNRKQ